LRNHLTLPVGDGAQGIRMKKHCCLEPHATTGHSLYYRPDIPPPEEQARPLAGERVSFIQMRRMTVVIGCWNLNFGALKSCSRWARLR